MPEGERDLCHSKRVTFQALLVDWKVNLGQRQGRKQSIAESIRIAS